MEQEQVVTTLSNKLVESIELNKELLEAYKDLLIDAEDLYQYYPNNFRATTEEYFKAAKELIKRVEEALK